MLCRYENLRRILDADGVVGRRMHHQQRLVQVCHLRHQIMLGDVVKEFALDVERPAGERDFHFAVLADVLDAIAEKMGDVEGIGRRRDGDHRFCVGNLTSRGQDRRSAKAVADQDRRRLPRFAQMPGGAHEIGDVRRKRRIGKIAFAGAQASEVEPQHCDALGCQRHRDPLGGQHVLAAGEAVREQRIGQRLALGHIKRCRELMAADTRELETFSRHGWPP